MHRRSFFLKLPLAAALSESFLSSARAERSGGDYFPPADEQGGWRAALDRDSASKKAGMDTAALDAAFEYTKQTSRFGGLLVARRGYLVYEKYFGRATRETTPNLYSIGKAFTSASMGILMEQKPAFFPDGLSQKVFTKKYLPAAFPLDDERKSRIELGQLLTMTSGMADEFARQGIVNGRDVKIEGLRPVDRKLGQDESAVRTPLWTDPGAGYCYCTQGVHVISMLVRQGAGMEMEQYIERQIASPLGFGGWGYAHKGLGGEHLPHTPGGFGIALRATDALRFAYLLLKNGRWNNRQVIPAAYLNFARKPSPFNPHAPFSFQFEVNQDGHVAGAPQDTFFKSGAGGHCVYAVPSLDLAVYKMSSLGDTGPDTYDLGFSRKKAQGDSSRDNWKPHTPDQFHDGPIEGDAGTRRTLEMVVAAIRD